MTDFTALLDELGAPYRSKKAFAEALGMSPSRFLRATKGEYTFDVLNCLKLAQLTGVSPSRVLRAAGKGDVADIVEALYGKQSITAAERQLLERWAALSPKARETLTTLMRELAGEKADKQPGRKTA